MYRNNKSMSVFMTRDQRKRKRQRKRKCKRKRQRKRKRITVHASRHNGQRAPSYHYEYTIPFFVENNMFDTHMLF